MTNTIRKDQIRKIKALQSRLKMTDEEYRLLLSEDWVESCTKLTVAEADMFIEKLQAEAIAKGVWQAPGTGQWHGKTKHEELNNRDGFATPKQLRYIEGLWKEVSRQEDQKARENALENFLLRIAHCQKLRFLTVRKAHIVIEAMKAMKEQKGGAKQ
jgi:hypothetical protein